MADLQKVIKLTSSQYSTLASGGTVGSYTGLDSSYLYLISDSTQYVPLGGTTSLYGSVVPSTTNSYTLGTNLKRFKSVYASHIDTNTAMANTLSASTIYTSWVQAGGSGVWTSQVICPASSMNIICDPAMIGMSAGGYLDIYAGSHIELSTPKSIFLYASGDMDLYAHGRNNIYAANLLKIWAGSFSDTSPVPRISMWLSGGYHPVIDIAANYSGYGELNIYAPSGSTKVNGRPVATGWLHHLCIKAATSDYYAYYYATLLTSSSTVINTYTKLWQALRTAGYYSSSNANFLTGGASFSYALPAVGIHEAGGGGHLVAGICAYYYTGTPASAFVPCFITNQTTKATYTINQVGYYTVTDRVNPIQ